MSVEKRQMHRCAQRDGHYQLVESAICLVNSDISKPFSILNLIFSSHLLYTVYIMYIHVFKVYSARD